MDLTSGIYGTRAQVKANRELIERELKTLGKITFVNQSDLSIMERVLRLAKRTESMPLVSPFTKLLKNFLVGVSPLEVLEVIPPAFSLLQGIPSEFIVRFAYFKSRKDRPTQDVDPVRDGCGLVWFAPIVPLTGDHGDRLIGQCQPVFHEHGFDFSVSFIVVNPRSAVALMEIFYNKEDVDETSRALALYETLAKMTEKIGYQQYRTNVVYSDRIKPAPSYRALVNKMKSAVDPRGTLADGRYGISSQSPQQMGQPVED